MIRMRSSINEARLGVSIIPVKVLRLRISSLHLKRKLRSPIRWITPLADVDLPNWFPRLTLPVAMLSSLTVPILPTRYRRPRGFVSRDWPR